MVRELAGHGYVVAAVDHPHDAYTGFPDGRLAVPDDAPTTSWTHAEELLFPPDRLDRSPGGPGRIGVFGLRPRGGDPAARTAPSPWSASYPDIVMCRWIISSPGRGGADAYRRRGRRPRRGPG